MVRVVIWICLCNLLRLLALRRLCIGTVAGYSNGEEITLARTPSPAACANIDIDMRGARVRGGVVGGEYEEFDDCEEEWRFVSMSVGSEW